MFLTLPLAHLSKSKQNLLKKVPCIRMKYHIKCSDDYVWLLHLCLKSIKNNIRSVIFCIKYSVITINRYLVMFLKKDKSYMQVQCTSLHKNVSRAKYDTILMF